MLAQALHGNGRPYSLLEARILVLRCLPDKKNPPGGPPGGFYFSQSEERSALGLGHLLFIHQLLQFTSFEHFHHDVASAQELAFDV